MLFRGLILPKMMKINKYKGADFSLHLLLQLKNALDAHIIYPVF